MVRFLISLIIGALIGMGIGLFVGWVVSPVEYVESPAAALAQRYKDDYTVMIAAGYRKDGDVNAAIQRLRVLGTNNVPLYVQEITERYITSSRNIEDIRNLVALAEGLGRLTPIMNDYRPVTVPEGGS